MDNNNFPNNDENPEQNNNIPVENSGFGSNDPTEILNQNPPTIASDSIPVAQPFNNGQVPMGQTQAPVNGQVPMGQMQAPVNGQVPMGQMQVPFNGQEPMGQMQVPFNGQMPVGQPVNNMPQGVPVSNHPVQPQQPYVQQPPNFSNPPVAGNDSSAFTLSLIALISSVVCAACIPFVGLILGFMGMSKANTAINSGNPDPKMKTAKVLAIVAIIISGLTILGNIIYYITADVYWF